MAKVGKIANAIALLVIISSITRAHAAPTITSISPNPAGVGMSVKIQGTNFGSSGSVTFNGVAASPTTWNTTSIVTAVPAGAATGNVVVTVAGQSSNSFPFTVNNGPVNYVYDDLGRLAGVIDVLGNAATYNYDAVGNILSITRVNPGQVSIMQFAPKSGPVGSPVTVQGTGFSATPSQDTVKFNGTLATVTSATTTQLQVTVPAGATSGTISVTTPNGTATSTATFTVAANSGTPTITSFSPGSGIAGSAVSLTGTNFDAYPVIDPLQLNVTPATNISSTATTISTTVPAATASGHFSLLTPHGQATSLQDFYVPFGSHVAADIGFTARAILGGSQTVSLAVGKIGLLLFDSSAEQWVSFGISNPTLQCGLYLIDPSNTVIGSTICNSGSPYLGSTYLSRAGTYTIGVDASTAGSVTLSPYADPLNSIAIDGPAITIVTTAASQNARLRFSAPAGQRIGIYVTNVTNPGTNLALVKPDGTTLASLFITNSPPGTTFFLDTQILAIAGTYQLVIQAGGVGSETLQIKSVPADFTATLTVPAAGTAGPAVQVPTTGSLAAGQNGILTFSGTAGQRLSFNVLNSTFGTDYSFCSLRVKDPSGNQIASGQCGLNATVYNIDTLTLPSTGTYSVVVDPLGATTGKVSISINNDADVTGSITIDGAVVTKATTVAGQDIRLSFTATAGQRIGVLATNVTNPGASLTLVKPDGTNQASLFISNSPAGSTFFLDTQTLSPAGTYQLWVPHSGTNIGSVSSQVKSVPSDQSGSVTIGGAAFPVSTVAGQNSNVTFSNPSSQSITIHWISGTYPGTLGCALTVTGPSPSTNQVGSGSCNTATGTVSLGTLASGTYNILIDPQAQSSGGISLTVTTP